MVRPAARPALVQWARTAYPLTERRACRAVGVYPVVRYHSGRPSQQPLRVRLRELTRPNEQWAMDFMHDTMTDDRAVRVLTMLDVYTRECVALIAAATFRGADVARALGTVGVTSGPPERITVDNGTEFTSKTFDHWAYWNRVQLAFSRPGKPVDNTFIEAFNGALRRECLSSHWFLSLEDLQRTLEL
jgi:putative transposase